MRIGIIGSGMMGSTLGKLWSRQGHEIVFSSRHPEQLEELARAAGNGARAGTVATAVEHGEVVFLGVPYHAMPALAASVAPKLQGKIVLDAGNLIPGRDGPLLDQVKASGKGTGSYTASLLSGSRVVKAFNTVHFRTLENTRRDGEARVGVPLAGDDPEALAVASRLVRESGCEPLVIGPLAASARIDFGSPVWNSNMSADEIARTLSVHPPA